MWSSGQIVGRFEVRMGKAEDTGVFHAGLTWFPDSADFEGVYVNVGEGETPTEAVAAAFEGLAADLRMEAVEF